MYGNSRTLVPVTILNGASLSAEVTVGAKRIVGIQMPAVWTTGAFTFQAHIGTLAGVETYGGVVDAAGAAVTVAAPTAGSYIVLSEAASMTLHGLGRIKVRSGTAGTPVNQGAQRDFFLVLTDY